METVGSFLCGKRKEKGMSLEDIHQKTKISIPALEALESDDFETIGVETYVKGFLKSYAAALDIDPQVILEKYMASQKAIVEDKEVRETLKGLGEDSAHTQDTPAWFLRLRLPRMEPWLMWVLVGAAACLSAYLVIGFFNAHAPQSAANYAKNMGEARQSIGLTDNVLYLTGNALEDTWLSVSSDGKPYRNYQLKKGDVKVWRARKKFYLKLANAGGVNLQVNDHPVGPLGRSGQALPWLSIDAAGRVSDAVPEGLTLAARTGD